MQTATEINALIERVYEQGRVELSGVSWDEYEALLSEIGDRYIFVSYNKGECEIMAPSEDHDVGKTLVGKMVEAIGYEMGISVLGFGSTTWRRPDARVGLEADECFYIQNCSRVEGHKVDLAVDPPPDLAIEVEVSRSAKTREPIYAALGVPELWRVKSGRVSFFELKSKRYAPIGKSLAFPQLASDDFNHYFEIWRTGKEFEGQRIFRQWVRDTLKPKA